MNDMLADIGDVVFTIVIGYIGALEFLYVVRHLYHWTFRHAEQHDNASNDADSLRSLQDDMRTQLSEAQAKENIAGTNAMQDGVLYKDGFRIDPQQADIEKLKAQKAMQDVKMQRQQELEAELKRQRKIEEETRKQLEAAEAALAQQRKQEEAEKHKQMEEEEKLSKAREEEQHKLQEEKEALQNAQKLLELERHHEEEQRRKETEKKEAQRKHEEDRRRQQEEEDKVEQKLREQELHRIEQEAEKEREREALENERRIIEAENRRIEEEMQKEIEKEVIEQQQRFAAEEKEAQIENEAEEDEQGIFEADEEEHENYEAAENIRKLIEAEILQEERQRQLEEEDEDDDDDEWSEQNNNVAVERERQRENKQKLIEENARKFLEAEQEMVELQQQMLEAAHKSELTASIESETPVVEKPCIKKIVQRDLHATEGVEIEEENEPPTQTVKTQFGQTSNEPYSVSTKPLLFPGVSDDGSSIEPNSMQSSFNTQPSEEIITGTEESSKTISLQFSQQTERPDPDAEDNLPAMQYTDDYLRSLDGIKQRPLVREDGSGRRRAFKKRRSSGSSNSSHDSRTSREEEVRMFTSLEEEEFQSAEKGDSDFTPIKYTEQKLKVKGHHRRNKRSPAKDTRTADESLRSSLEMLGEESTNPWGEVVPEHYKDTAFWKREKAMSIDEEEIDLDKLGVREKTKNDVADLNKPKTSSFEEATDAQNEEAITALQKQLSQETRDKDVARTADTNEATNENKKNLETSRNTEHTPSPNRSSPRLRRSPRIDEMDQYEERWKSATQQTPNTPNISVEYAEASDTWRDEYGLIMEGLSDFYDFQASVNPSRSRSTSRNPSPANSQPNTPTTLKNISFNSEAENEAENSKADDAYKDTDMIMKHK